MRYSGQMRTGAVVLTANGLCAILASALQWPEADVAAYVECGRRAWPVTARRSAASSGACGSRPFGNAERVSAPASGRRGAATGRLSLGERWNNTGGIMHSFLAAALAIFNDEAEKKSSPSSARRSARNHERLASSETETAPPGTPRPRRSMK